MRLHTFIYDFDFSKNTVLINDFEQINQIKNVFRLKKDDFLNLGDGKGKIAKCLIVNINKKNIECKILEITNKKEIEKKVHLYLAILKKENFELAIQKSVECGVFSVTPIKTQRTIKNNLNEARLLKIVKEASEQSGQAYLPKINKIKNFEEAIQEAEKFEKKIIFDISGEKTKANKNTKETCIFVGPEGGFTEEEIEKARKLNYQVETLGSLTLRAETAAIVATFKEVSSLS